MFPHFPLPCCTVKGRKNCFVKLFPQWTAALFSFFPGVKGWSMFRLHLKSFFALLMHKNPIPVILLPFKRSLRRAEDAILKSPRIWIFQRIGALELWLTLHRVEEVRTVRMAKCAFSKGRAELKRLHQSIHNVVDFKWLRNVLFNFFQRNNKNWDLRWRRSM